MTTLTTPTPEIERDRYGRPMVIPPEGGKKIAYTRATTFVSVLEDTYNLSRWQQRMVAIGLADRPDLLLSVAAHRDDRDQLNEICGKASEAAQAHAGATIGTALHALTERLDRGQELGVVPDQYLPDIAAYTEATKGLVATHIEQFTVLDSLKVGGTPDRVVKYRRKRYIADLKTGSIEWGIGKIAMQLAVYARSLCYDITTGQRTSHDADLERGIIIHSPAGTGTTTLYWVDLITGWEGVKHAKWVREWRTHKMADLTEPFIQTMSRDPVANAIWAAKTVEELNGVWAEYRAVWTPEWTTIAAKHKETIETKTGLDNVREGVKA
jgi:hypothetical protein